MSKMISCLIDRDRLRAGIVMELKMNRCIFLSCSMFVASLTSAQPLTVDSFNRESSYQFMASDGAFLVHSVQKKMPNVLHMQLDNEIAAARRIVVINSPASETALSLALARAWKRDFIEEGVEGTRNVLIECQKETSLLLTMPFMRSDGQQAHCFRF